MMSCICKNSKQFARCTERIPEYSHQLKIVKNCVGTSLVTCYTRGLTISIATHNMLHPTNVSLVLTMIPTLSGGASCLTCDITEYGIILQVYQKTIYTAHRPINMSDEVHLCDLSDKRNRIIQASNVYMRQQDQYPTPSPSEAEATEKMSDKAQPKPFTMLQPLTCSGGALSAIG